MMSPALASALQVVRESDDVGALRAAIFDLGYEKQADIYPLLVKKLDDPSPGVQHAAVVSLGRFGRPEGIDEIVKPKIYRSPHGNIRWAAVAAVGKLGDYRVIDHLLKAVEDPEWIVRTQAVTEVIGKVRDIIERKDVRLARILVHMLSLENEEIVNLAIEGFQALGAETLPLLHEALTNSSATIRANAARALGKLHAHQSTPFLLELLCDSYWTVRAGAAEALGFIGDRVAIEPLVLGIQDNVGGVRDQAAAAIVRIGKAATIPLLNALARERDKFALRAILRCLGLIGDPKAVPALIVQLRSSYFIVRQVAVAALIGFGPSVVNLLLPTLSFNRSDIEPFKKDACDIKHPELQLRAIKALGGLEDHRAVLLLKELVEKGLPDIQEAAMQALSQIGCASWGRCCALRVLGEVGEPSLVSSLLPSLKDNSPTVRLEAVRALGKIGGREAVARLVHLAAKDGAEFIRVETIRLLRTAGVGQSGVSEVALRSLKDESREVRCEAARLLGLFQDRKTILPLLDAMADKHWSVRESAENALLNFGAQAVRPLAEALESDSWTLRFRAARLLGEVGEPGAIPVLERLIGRKGERKNI
ncbi:MAG: HEAT repeat domain-containing protein, partial [Candidatus Aminicenantes bacterium]|nr:HEAT repeat domain-containing protein [Candidatus Aminicenantes bacterium]